MMTIAPTCLFYQIITVSILTFIYLTLARLVGSERYLICEKQANIGQVNATIYLVSVSLSREIAVVNRPEFSQMRQLCTSGLPLHTHTHTTRDRHLRACIFASRDGHGCLV